MADLTRTEYPGMMSAMQPGQAIQTLNDRVKRINKINLDIADWLQERRKVEEQYATSMRKLAQMKIGSGQTDLGVFQTPWARVLGAAERIAQSHHLLAETIERDIEFPLRGFVQRNDVISIQNMSSNLSAMAKDLDDAQGKADKLSKKGGKTSAEKMDAASSRLDSAQQQWDSQAPYVFESLQALDESRINQLRDYLTQYETHESDQATRLQKISEETLAVILEINTETEITGFVHSGAEERPMTRTSTRRSSVAVTPSSTMPPPPMPTNTGLSTSSNNQGSTPTRRPPTAASQYSADDVPQMEGKPESKLRRLGTLFGGRKRQSMANFGQLSPSKGGSPGFGKLGGSQGRGVSPRASASNLHESNKLSSLAEDPDTINSPLSPNNDSSAPAAANGLDNGISLGQPQEPAAATNGTADLSNVAPPPGPPPGKTDAEGFTVREAMNDPISEAQREAAGDDPDHPFKLNIQNQPVAEEDADAKQAAFSSVANNLKMGPAMQRSGTLRGRRDVRNTIYKPAPVADTQAGSTLSSIPADDSVLSSTAPIAAVAPAAVPATLASETSVAGISDNQSVRSGTSLSNFTHMKHPDMTEPGLNSSIIESVSAHFDDGVIKNAVVAGEIAFVNNRHDSDDTKTHETIRINNFPKLEKIGPNRIFVQNSTPDQPDQFSLDLSHLNKTSTAFSYRVYADDSDTPSLAAYAPLQLKPAWKPQGDKLGLLLQYQRNPSCTLSGPVTLHNVVFVATYAGKASGAQTKPSGTHLKEKHLVYWRLGDVTLTDKTQKIVCRIIGADGTEPAPGHVEARWEYQASSTDAALASGISVSRLDTKGKGKGKAKQDDPFSDNEDTDDQNWIQVPLSTKLVSGKYESQ